jgi:hypothetical protein
MSFSRLIFQNDFGEKGTIGDFSFEKIGEGWLVGGRVWVRAGSDCFVCPCGKQTAELKVKPDLSRIGCPGCWKVARKKKKQSIAELERLARVESDPKEQRKLYLLAADLRREKRRKVKRARFPGIGVRALRKVTLIMGLEHA